MANDNFFDLIPHEFSQPSEGFKAAMKVMDIHYWYFDVESRHLIVGSGFLETKKNQQGYVHIDEDEIKELIHPDDQKKNAEAIKALIKGSNSVYEVELRIRPKSVWSWHYIRGAIIIMDENGFPKLIGGITMDISRDYRQTLSKLEESGKFEFIFRNTSQPVMIGSMASVDSPGAITEVNQATLDLFQCSESELLGVSPYHLVASKEIGTSMDLTGMLRANSSIELELKVKTFKGESRYIQVNAHAFNEGNKELFIAVVQDKTAEENIRKELKASESALKRNERIYRSLIQAADDRIGIFDDKGNIILINNAFSAKLGFTHDEFMQLKDKERIHPADIERLKENASSLFNKGGYSAEYRVKHRNGHYLHMSTKAVLLNEPDNSENYVLLVIRDISDKIDFQRELIRAKERAEESDRLKSAFLANISHEIRTPMNSIVGFANLLVDNSISNDEKEEYVERVNRNSSQLLALISDIIDLAKIESNQLSIIYNKVRINDLMEDIRQFAEHQRIQQGKKNIKIIYDPDPANLKVSFETDVIRITQVLQNLINNAVKFTNTGQITIGYRMLEKTTLQLYVKDTGTGIDAVHHDIIFDQFRQVDGTNTRSYGGTGLGLAISKNLIELLRGRIYVSSEVDKGSEFFIELPLKSDSKIKVARASKADHQSGLNELSILVVDDDPDSLMLLTTIFQREGINAKVADSGYKALQILESEELPEIVLLDLQMPVLNGLQTMRIIKEKYPDLKIIAQSAHGYETDRKKYLDEGFDGYISKPYTRMEIINLIRSAIGS